MNDRTYPMTQSAYEELKAELEHKVTVEKPALAARLKAAIEMGDLSENADYITAKEDQGFLEGRINELEELIRGAQIIDESRQKTDVVALGSHVVIQEEGFDDQEEYMIVGKVEAAPRKNKISDESPLGQALLGRKKGDIVTVNAPAGDMTFKIIDVK